jgi:hypothetical protein
VCIPLVLEGAEHAIALNYSEPLAIRYKHVTVDAWSSACD